MGYQHLTLEQRCQIAAHREAGLIRAQIAARLGYHPSTVGREIRRNSGDGR